jgi:hypothetical protein
MTLFLKFRGSVSVSEKVQKPKQASARAFVGFNEPVLPTCISREKDKSSQLDMISSAQSGEGRVGVNVLAHDESRGNAEGIEFY